MAYPVVHLASCKCELNIKIDDTLPDWRRICPTV